jgi:predicted alpha/beta hydrolase
LRDRQEREEGPPPELLRVTAGDGVTHEARLFVAAGGAAPVVFCLPAMGVPARFYDPFGRALAARGFTAAVADLRGHGSSSLRPRRGVDFGYRELVERDWPATCAALRARFPGQELFVLGHSLGGQVHSMAVAQRPGGIAGLILVASGSVHYRGFPAHRRPFILGGTLAASGLARLLGYFPGHKVGFGGREAARLIADWARLGRSGRFRATGSDFDFEAGLAAFRAPVLAIDVAGDTLAPRGTVDELCRKLRAAAIDRWQLRPAKPGPRWHFQWARRPDEVAERVAAWIDRLPPRAA